MNIDSSHSIIFDIKMIKTNFTIFMFMLPFLMYSQEVTVEGKFQADSIDVNFGQINNLGNPTLPQDAASKAYVDSLLSNLPTITTYSVGDFAQGGVVFWVDGTGQHGLVCSTQETYIATPWDSYGMAPPTIAKGDGIYSGEMNTSIIISVLAADGPVSIINPARRCNETKITEGGTTYGYWYLPSKYELKLICINNTTIDSIATANGGDPLDAFEFWSSTEYSDTEAHYQDFTNGTQNSTNKGLEYTFRPIRSF